MDDELDPTQQDAQQSEGQQEAPSLVDALTSQLGIDQGPDESNAPESAEAGEATPQPAEAAQAEPKPEAKPDPNAELYAPLPEHNPRKTHERFQRLIDGHKTLTAERDTVAKERDEYRQRVESYEAGFQQLREMGFDSQDAAEDLSEFAQYRKALASGNIDAAMGMLQAQLQQLAIASGRRVEVSPLTAYPELAERVQSGALDEQTAIQLARLQHSQNLQQQRTQQSQAAEQQHAQQMQAIRQGAAQVDQIAQQLAADPDYKAVEPALMKQLDYIRSNFQPHQWAAEVKRAYEYEKRILVAEARAQQQSRQQATPIRASGQSAGNPAPASMAEAAIQALGLS